MSSRVFFDLETGGLDDGKHPVIEIAAIAVDFGAPGLPVLEEFKVKVTVDPAECDPHALEVNGWTPDAWADAWSPIAAIDEFDAFIGRHRSIPMVSQSSGRPYKLARLVAHNAAFDGPFYRKWRSRALGRSQFFPAEMRVLCTMQLAMWYFEARPELVPPESYKLAELARHFGVEHPEAHRAMDDCRASLGLAREILRLSR